ITSTVIIYLFLGPPLFKLAIERVGESTSARARGLENLSSGTDGLGAGEGPETMPTPEVEDEALGQRLRGLREAALDLDRRICHGRVAGRLGALEASVDGALAAADELLSQWTDSAAEG